MITLPNASKELSGRFCDVMQYQTPEVNPPSAKRHYGPVWTEADPDIEELRELGIRYRMGIGVRADSLTSLSELIAKEKRDKRKQEQMRYAKRRAERAAKARALELERIVALRAKEWAENVQRAREMAALEEEQARQAMLAEWEQFDSHLLARCCGQVAAKILDIPPLPHRDPSYEHQLVWGPCFCGALHGQRCVNGYPWLEERRHPTNGDMVHGRRIDRLQKRYDARYR